MLTCRRSFCLALLVLLVVTPPRVEAQLLAEREVKAAFLVNFAKFTEWPTAAFPDATAPIVLGVAGDEALRQTIEHLAKGKVFNGRALKTRNVRNPQDAAQTHLLFVGGLWESRAGDLLQATHGLPVLTVGDSDRFRAQGGMIAFLFEGNRLRFEIRLDATEQAQLKVSSRVLTLAKTVHGRK